MLPQRKRDLALGPRDQRKYEQPASPTTSTDKDGVFCVRVCIFVRVRVCLRAGLVLTRSCFCVAGVSRSVCLRLLMITTAHPPGAVAEQRERTERQRECGKERP